LRRSNITSEGRLLATITASFLVMALLAALDIGSDLREGTTSGHVLVEAGILLVGFVGAGLAGRKLIMTLRRAHSAERQALNLASQLQESAAEASRWRNEVRDLMAGLAQAIDTQFDRWQLSVAEKEVALLLLKGLSHKEIAVVRSVTEATARQQARAVYQKGGLGGRADLAAFFLEDLMLPQETTQSSDPPTHTS